MQSNIPSPDESVEQIIAKLEAAKDELDDNLKTSPLEKTIKYFSLYA